MKIFYYEAAKRKDHIVDGGYYYHSDYVLGFGNDTAADETEVTVPQAIARIMLAGPVDGSDQPLSVADAKVQAQTFLAAHGITVVAQDLVDAEPLITELILNKVREVRAPLLLNSDWTQLNDTPLENEVVAQWTTYRQHIRDLPATFNTVLRYIDVIWPDAPSA